jgi:hypothetical protein
MPYHILPGFRVRRANNSRQDHWLGGPATHNGAVCRVCDRPMLLLWDLNCSDPRFRIRGRSVFKDLERLPLYYCWRCAADLEYRVSAADRIVVLQHEGTYQGDDFPYESYPSHFDRQPLELDLLTQIPKATKKIIDENDSPDRLPSPARKALEKWLGHSVEWGLDIWWHQFGGKPWLVQGPEKIICANKECSWHRRKWAMKVLASIINDPLGGLPMIESSQQVRMNNGKVNTWVQVVFHICPGCLSIHVGNRCD